MLRYRTRRRIKAVGSRIFGAITELNRHGPCAHVAVLCYHSIGDTGSFLSIGPAAFRDQIQALIDLDFSFATFGELVGELETGEAPSRNLAVITFDDGYADGLTMAAPILERMGIRASFFVTTGLVLGERAVVERFARLTSYETDYLSPAMIRTLHEGGMEIGAHTHSHPNLARLTRATADWELRRSRAALEDITGAPVDLVAYPFGKPNIHYTPETMALARAAGYRAAAAVSFRLVGPGDAGRLFEIPRFFITPDDTLATLADKVLGRMDWIGHLQDRCPAWLKARVSPEENVV